MYANKDTKYTYGGVKQMKDTTRVTLMVCTTEDGNKVPLAVVGKPKKLMCFRVQTRNGLSPVPCIYQRNDWLDQTIIIWWIGVVLWLYHLNHYGDQYYILLLNNFSALKVGV